MTAPYSKHLAATLAVLIFCIGSAHGADVEDSAAQASVTRVSAATTHAASARDVGILSIVIDDLGDRRAEGLRAVELPGPVTYAILPHTAYASTLARLAHSLGKEVLVHMPMEAISGNPLGRGGLTAKLSHEQFVQRTRAAINSVPHARGVSNHMGSRLTAMGRPMQWFMEIVRTRGDWIFLDSRTTADSIAATTATEAGLRAASRDVFLDHDISVGAIRARFREAIAKARTHGSAIAIGHPYAETLQVLVQELPLLVGGDGIVHVGAEGRSADHATARNDRSVRLVPLSQVIAKRARTSWRIAQSEAVQLSP